MITMPRKGPLRPRVTIRVAEKGIAYIDQLAANYCVNRSEMVRQLVSEGLKVMPAHPKITDPHQEVDGTITPSLLDG